MRKIGSILLCIVFLSSVFCISGCSSCNKSQVKSSYDIECKLDGNLLCGTEEAVFYNFTDNTFNQLKFNLYPNAFRKDAKYSPISNAYYVRAYPNGESYGEINITSVSDGKDLEYGICGEDKNILVVYLDREIFPNESVEVKISFETTLANVIARTGINDKTINLANFYPILCGIEGDNFYECVYYSNGDPYFSDCANYTVNIDIPSKYNIACSGKIVKKTESEDRCIYQIKLDSARSFNMVLSEYFDVLSAETNGITVNYYYYNDKNAKKSLDVIVSSLEYFSQVFGEYPYSEYSVAETKFLQGGMEFPCLSFVSDDLEESAYREVLIHETAHQWWQTAVGNNEIEYAFLDEGLAEYSVVLYYENHSEYGYSRQDLITSSERTYRNFCSISDKLFANTDTCMIRNLKDFKSEYEYVNIAYVKPCIMYDYLRNTVGDDKFFTALSKYYDNYKLKNALPDDLVGTFEKVGTDTNGFFESFFNGKVII